MAPCSETACVGNNEDGLWCRSAPQTLHNGARNIPTGCRHCPDGGYFPAFANLVAEEQLKIGKGTITVYDPCLVFNEPKYINMTLHKEYFTTNTDVSNHDLLVGIYPCEATEAIIESAIKNDKDFYVAMCGDAHSSDGSRITKVTYREKVINTANNLALTNGNYEMEVTKFDDPIYSYPIVIGKRTK